MKENKLEKKAEKKPSCGENPRKRWNVRRTGICDKAKPECPYYESAIEGNSHSFLYKTGKTGFCKYE